MKHRALKPTNSEWELQLTGARGPCTASAICTYLLVYMCTSGRGVQEVLRGKEHRLQELSKPNPYSSSSRCSVAQTRAGSHAIHEFVWLIAAGSR